MTGRRRGGLRATASAAIQRTFLLLEEEQYGIKSFPTFLSLASVFDKVVSASAIFLRVCIDSASCCCCCFHFFERLP
jgi:hypothetical protein